MFNTVRQFVELTAVRFDPLLNRPDLPDNVRSRPVMKDHRLLASDLPSEVEVLA